MISKGPFTLGHKRKRKRKRKFTFPSGISHYNVFAIPVFPRKTAAINVNLRFWLYFCPSVKASTVLNHSKFTLRIRFRLRPSVN